MKPSLKAGLKHRFSYTVPKAKTVPYLYTEAPELQEMPEVFATGFMVGLMEWTCVQLLAPISTRARVVSGCISTSCTRPRPLQA